MVLAFLVIIAVNIAFVYIWQVFRIVLEEPMPQKRCCYQTFAILIRCIHPEIIRGHQALQRISEFQLKFVSMGLDIIQCPVVVRRCVLCVKNSRKACEKCKFTFKHLLSNISNSKSFFYFFFR